MLRPPPCHDSGNFNATNAAYQTVDWGKALLSGSGIIRVWGGSEEAEGGGLASTGTESELQVFKSVQGLVVVYKYPNGKLGGPP